MKGVRFYQEFDTTQAKRRGEPNGNVFAVFIENGINPVNGCYEGLGAVFFHPNSEVAGTAAHPQYLRERCKRISESEARRIHPALFKRLDAND